jgi:hypothetical protein
VRSGLTTEPASLMPPKGRLRVGSHHQIDEHEPVWMRREARSRSRDPRPDRAPRPNELRLASETAWRRRPRGSSPHRRPGNLFPRSTASGIRRGTVG